MYHNIYIQVSTFNNDDGLELHQGCCVDGEDPMKSNGCYDLSFSKHWNQVNRDDGSILLQTNLETKQELKKYNNALRRALRIAGRHKREDLRWRKKQRIQNIKKYPWVQELGLKPTYENYSLLNMMECSNGKVKMTYPVYHGTNEGNPECFIVRTYKISDGHVAAGYTEEVIETHV